MAMDKNKGKGKPAPSKQVTSKNYETGKTTKASGLRSQVQPGGFMTGKVYTTTNKKGQVSGIGAVRNTNKAASKKKK
jgi:hypothetical protein